jgi:flagellar protein FliS
MTFNASDEYLQSAVMTATPEQLQMMLYDGAIRFCRQAKEAILRKDFETSCEKLIRSQRIVSQLKSGLRPEVNPVLCEQLADVYDFLFRRLVDANMKRETGLIDEVLQILEHQRETWRILLEKVKGIEFDSTRAGSVQPADAPLSLSVEG